MGTRLSWGLIATLTSVFLGAACRSQPDGDPPLESEGAPSDVLARALKAPPDTRVSAIYGLLGIHRGTPTDLSLSGGINRDTRQRMLEATKTRQPSSRTQAIVDVLVQCLQDEQSTIRIAAADVLSQFGPEAATAVPALRAIHADEDELVRAYGAGALYFVGDESAFPIVECLRLLRSSDARVRLRALSVLWGMGPDALPALPEIRDLASDSDLEVQRLSHYVTGRLTRR